ncbi:MAG: phosphonopyruvate decarboxylase [Treponema sp.]|jgi:phosphonopyruvate decarboxylase|nr:phosphonopyruvate decarboxylase [Treponema sp.]
MSITPAFFYNLLIEQGTDFFTGVPDSLLKSICAYITDNSNNHIIAVNEGSAIALASGYHLATGKIPLVYMQNSGIGNAVNPLLSLADGDVYRIPIILLIGWRGEPGTKDEPQHIKQGKVTCSLFDAMNIPYLIINPNNEDEVKNQIYNCYSYVKKENTPFALIIKKDTFAPYSLSSVTETGNETPEAVISREEAIEEIICSSEDNEVFISTTGMASRELFELRKKHNMGHEKDFLTVGSMGHSSSLALGIALQKPNQPVTCIDGDGAALMHLGNFAAIGAQKPKNLRHFVLNNAAHDSVGGQPTIADKIDLPGIAFAAGYDRIFFVKTKEELQNVLKEKERPLYIEILVRKGSRKDLGRPSSSPQENKKAFMQFLLRGES